MNTLFMHINKHKMMHTRQFKRQLKTNPPDNKE